MNRKLPFALAVALCGGIPLMAQQHPESHPAPAQAPHESAPPKGNGGHIPPPPSKREAPKPNQHVEEHPQAQPGGHPPPAVKQHVENDKWIGHDTNDARYHVAKPFPHGRFERFGQNYRYPVERVDVSHHRFWFPGGFYFQVADWDWVDAAGWCWNCGDDFVVYEDPDHPGWYLVYNVQTGEYVHAEYMGS